MLKRGLLLFSIILITVGVGLCGCMSSNEGGNSKTIGGLEKVEVANTQKVETTPLSNTVKVKVGDKEIEMSKSDYDALTKHIVPDWFIIRLGRDLHVSKDKIEEVLQHKKEASEDTIIMIPTHLGDVEGIYGYVYEDVCLQIRHLWTLLKSMV